MPKRKELIISSLNPKFLVKLLNIGFVLSLDCMPIAKVKVGFEPDILKGSNRSEFTLKLSVSAPDATKEYWCECDIVANKPLTLAHDKDLHIGRTRVGILNSERTIEKQVKLYTMPGMSVEEYMVSVTTYLYDEDGAITERYDTSGIIRCEVSKT